MARREHVCIVLPSLKISGGNRELLRLADELSGLERNVDLLSMWRSPHESPTGSHQVCYLSNWKTNPWQAFAQLPVLWLRFRKLVRRPQGPISQAGSNWVFSHYATLPLALCVPRARRWFFVQDIEWRFLASPLLAAILRRVILYFYARGRAVSANPYLTSELRALGIEVTLEAPIWADVQFASQATGQRDIDVAMVLRKGDHKRTDLYLECIRRARVAGMPWRVAVITPEDDIQAQVAPNVTVCLLRPTAQAMRELYARSRVFLHLSDHEGFGLPPLEAMGSGCVPVCRDSGGIRAYMTDGLQALVHARDLPMNALVDVVDALLNDTARWQVLSSLAKRVFDRGVARTSSRRQALADWHFESNDL